MGIYFYVDLLFYIRLPTITFLILKRLTFGLKKTIAIFLLLSFVSQLIGVGIAFLAFKINQKEIAKTLCVNKAVKNSTCCGLCYLKQQVKQQSDQNPTPGTKATFKFQLKSIQVILNSDQIIIDKFAMSYLSIKSKVDILSTKLLTGHHTLIDHPPLVYFFYHDFLKS